MHSALPFSPSRLSVNPERQAIRRRIYPTEVCLSRTFFGPPAPGVGVPIDCHFSTSRPAIGYNIEVMGLRPRKNPRVMRIWASGGAI